MKKYLMMILVGTVIAFTVCGCGASGGSGETAKQGEDVSVLTKAQVEQMYSDGDAFKGSKVTLTGCVFSSYAGMCPSPPCSQQRMGHKTLPEYGAP